MKIEIRKLTAESAERLVKEKSSWLEVALSHLWMTLALIIIPIGGLILWYNYGTTLKGLIEVVSSHIKNHEKLVEFTQSLMNTQMGVITQVADLRKLLATQVKIEDVLNNTSFKEGVAEQLKTMKNCLTHLLEETSRLSVKASLNKQTSEKVIHELTEMGEIIHEVFKAIEKHSSQ